MFDRLYVSLTLVQLRSRGFLLSRGKLELRRVLRLFCFTVFLVPLLLCFPVIVYAQPDSTQEVYEYVMQWGSYGSDTGQFNGPSGMCIDDTGYIYVCDRWNYRIQKFDRNGNFILMWGRQGSGQGEFNEPYDITADHSGYVYVNDGANYRIQKFDSRGNFILMWPEPSIAGAAGLDRGPLNQIFITEPYDSVGVYDTLGNKIRAFDNGFGTRYWDPQALCCDDSGFVYVARAPVADSIIFKFDSTGHYISRWGELGTGDGQFSQVYTMRSGEGCKIFTPDAPFVYPNYRVQKFNSKGLFITKWGSQGTGNGQFMQPFSVVVDSEGYAYVSDPEFGVNRIQKFRKSVVGVVQDISKEPFGGKGYSLNALSPVRDELILSFSLPREESITIGLYDVSGRRVKNLLEGKFEPGVHKLRETVYLSSGVYFLGLDGQSGRKAVKVLVVR